jgi:hypothetical protein
LRRYDDPLFKAAADQTLLTRHDRFCRSHSKTLYLLINCTAPKKKDRSKSQKRLYNFGLLL